MPASSPFLLSFCIHLSLIPKDLLNSPRLNLQLTAVFALLYRTLLNSTACSLSTCKYLSVCLSLLTFSCLMSLKTLACTACSSTAWIFQQFKWWCHGGTWKSDEVMLPCSQVYPEWVPSVKKLVIHNRDTDWAEIMIGHLRRNRDGISSKAVMEWISLSSGENGLSAEETELIRALVLTQPAVGLLFVDFGDEVWN